MKLDFEEVAPCFAPYPPEAGAKVLPVYWGERDA
jgi:hypothetical protein